MSSNRSNIHFEIQADDPTRAAEFYSEVFGWQFSAINGFPVRILANSSDRLGGRVIAQTSAEACGYVRHECVCLLFEVESYNATERKILRLGGTVALPKFAVPGRCWQGYYIDSEASTFGVFEVDQSAGD